ncbi:hypothetical protein Bca52824_092728 [Brassica carinata]|uniref:Uncharacterized protein n=1 Tax=Brassica carinata TaxID=52824 RepID=A0A8X7TKN3_BRACI|nr:hypothetical protein Bca52824_092728 [Brassica carinata]
MALIYEYMANGNFQEYLSSEKTENLSWEKRLHIAIDSAQGWFSLLLGYCKMKCIRLFSVTKVEKAPLEEIKEAVELPLTHADC